MEIIPRSARVLFIGAALTFGACAQASMGGHLVSPDDDLAKISVYIATDITVSKEVYGKLLLSYLSRRCSGVLAEPDLVITAAHCFESSDGRKTTAVAVSMGVHISRDEHGMPADALQVTGFLVEPSYAEDSPHGNDIALIRLAAPVATFSRPFPIANVAQRTPYTQVTEVGYGVTAMPPEPDDTEPQLRSVKTYAHEGDVHVIPMDQIEFEPNSLHTILPGDSGGAVIVEINGVKSIVGVNVVLYNRYKTSEGQTSDHKLTGSTIICAHKEFLLKAARRLGSSFSSSFCKEIE